MPKLAITADEMTEVAKIIWDDRQHMPAQIWVDHFHEEHTFLRATYPKEMCKICLDRLHDFKVTIMGLYGADATVTVVVYQEEIPVEEAVLRSTTINLVP